MKKTITILGAIIFVSLITTSCMQNSSKKKELELRERELALKEKQLALDSAKNIQPQLTNNKSNVANFTDVKSFFNFFKQAIEKNDKENLFKYYIQSSTWNKNKFMKEYNFSNRVKKIILNTNNPEYIKADNSYIIEGNDGREGEAMFFTIKFTCDKKGNWNWDMSYAD